MYLNNIIQFFSNLFNWQLFNTIFTIRCILKYFTEILTEEQLIEHIEYNGNGNVLETLIGSFVGIIVDVPVNDSTYLIHLESITCLLILLSVQFYSGRRSDQSHIYRLIMVGKHVIHAPILVKSLLTNYIHQAKLPPAYFEDQGQSLVIGNLTFMFIFTYLEYVDIQYFMFSNFRIGNKFLVNVNI